MNVSALIPALRLHLGDTDSSAYRYLDEWLKLALVLAIQTLGRRWSNKYLVDENSFEVSRNPDVSTFVLEEPPVIQPIDIRPIILQASIIIKNGSLEANAWNLVSWRDYEVSYSNLESGRQRDNSLKMDIEELDSILKPPSKRVGKAIRINFPEEE